MEVLNPLRATDRPRHMAGSFFCPLPSIDSYVSTIASDVSLAILQIHQRKYCAIRKKELLWLINNWLTN